MGNVILISIASVAILSIVILIKSRREKKFGKMAFQFKEPVTRYFEDLSYLSCQYVSYNDENLFIVKWKKLYSDVIKCHISKRHEMFVDFNRFKKSYKSLHEYFFSHNERFIHIESTRYNGFFSDIDGKSLDGQQREAVIADESRILVLAGAGSGKTLTIAAKVKYLCEIKHVEPKDILLISFTKKSAQEMTDRIRIKLGIDIEATTFHKLGLDIIKYSDGIRPEVSDESVLNKFVHDFFENKLLQYPNLIKDLTEYFTYYIELPESIDDYSSVGELYEAEKNRDLETLKSKYEREKYLQDTKEEKAKLHTTLNNEIVKSNEETIIANFLFMNGVRYEYERLYPYESNDPFRKAYRPDFYLLDFDIYLEHFGVTEDFRVPWLSAVEEQMYLDGIKWKRKFHKQCKTKLIETYSYYNSKGILIQKLEELLVANGVTFKPRNFNDIFNTVYLSKSNKYFFEFIKLCCTFITLFKSNNYRESYISEFRRQIVRQEKNKFLRDRTVLFLNIVEILLKEYQKYLSANNAIDFSDMINKAADKIMSGCEIPSYKYVIVDEYQDISKSRFNFLKAIADKTGAKYFCVGDDWQSIYRFAGSDISLFTDFEKYFGPTKIMRIEKTYRNSQQLIDVASNFILQNPNQLIKNLRSDKYLDYPLVFWGYNGNPNQVLQLAINKILSEYGTNSSILLLGRTNYDVEVVKNSGLFRVVYEKQKEKLEYVFSPEVKIEFLSVHKSKGLEADNVILLNFKNDKLGFPNQIADDRVLDLVLTNSENFRFAEERRLFYVAITRTKNRTFVLTDNNNPSVFLREFSESKSVCFVSLTKKYEDKQTKCPRCKTGNLLRVGRNGKFFVGCSNFPQCDYTVPYLSVLEKPVKCPSCGGFLINRKGKNGHWFMGCTNYPYCQYTSERI